jgi:hypothetical protein
VFGQFSGAFFVFLFAIFLRARFTASLKMVFICYINEGGEGGNTAGNREGAMAGGDNFPRASILPGLFDGRERQGKPAGAA